MVAFNKGFGFPQQPQIGRGLGFPQQPQIGRGLVNSRNNPLRPGTLTQMPYTQVGRLTGESPKTGDVDNKPNENKAMSGYYFDSMVDFDKAVRDGKVKDGDEVVVKYTTEDGETMYLRQTCSTSSKYNPTAKWFKDKDCTIPYTV